MLLTVLHNTSIICLAGIAKSNIYNCNLHGEISVVVFLTVMLIDQQRQLIAIRLF